MNEKIEQTLSIIKPDAVERNLIDEIQEIFKKNNLHIKESKKFIFQRRKLQNSTRFINLNHFTMICVLICPLAQ